MKYRIIYRDSKKPYMIPTGIYETSPEELIFNDHEKVQKFVKDRPSLSYELLFEKIEPKHFDPQTANVFVERPAHTMRVGDIIRSEYDTNDSTLEVVKIEEIKDNVFNVLFHDSTGITFAVNEKVLFLEEFETHYKLTYTKKIPSSDLSKIEEFTVTTWSPSKEIHEQRIARLKENKSWKISDLKESVYLMKKISERPIDE